MSTVSDLAALDAELPPSVREMLEYTDAETPPLADYLAALARDPSLWWRTPFDHQHALFLAAVTEPR